MGDFFEGAGASGSLRAANQSLQNTAFGIRRQQELKRRTDIMGEGADVQNALNMEQLNQIKTENKRKNTVIGIDTALQMFDDPEVQKYAYSKAKSMDLVKDVEGNEAITVGDGETFLKTFFDPKNPYALEASNIRLNSLTKQKTQIQQMMAQEKNPKKQEELAAALRQANIKYNQALNQTGLAKQASEWTREGYTQPSIQKALDAGGDRNLLELRPDVLAKNAESGGLTLNQLLTQTRQFYAQRAKQYLDPLIGTVKPEYVKEHEDLMKKQDEDLALIDSGKKSKWIQGLMNDPVQTQELKEITEDIVREYLDMFDGDIKKAEKAARKDGYDF